MDSRSTGRSLRDQYLQRSKLGRLPNLVDLTSQSAAFSASELADVVMLDISESWKAGAPRSLRDHLERFPQLTEDHALLVKMIEHEYQVLHENGQHPEVDSFMMQFPGLDDLVRGQLFQTQQVSAQGNSYLERGVPVRPAQLQPNAAIPDRLGRYEIREKIGNGQFGVVYRAFDPRLDRDVAIKVPLWRGFSNEQITAFETEARNLAQLHHSNVVAVYDFGETEDGGCYIVSQYIDGDSLSDLLHSRRPGMEETVALIASVAEGLHAAHQRQIIHRDIKPANILLNRQGHPFVTDFGLALREEKNSQPDRIDGSPAYMSPEQTIGKLRNIDGRSDVWSLGVVLYEMLTGVRPFRAGQLKQLFEQIRHSPPTSPRLRMPKLDSSLERICLTCLQKSPGDRFASAQDLAGELRQLLAPRPEQSRSELFRVATVFPLEQDPFPTLGCTLVNRSEEPLVIQGLELELIEFKAVRGDSTSRMLSPIATIDVELPVHPGNYAVPVQFPILLASRDAATVAIRLSCLDANGVAQSPAAIGGFRFRLTFRTDGQQVAMTDELKIGRI